MVVQTVRRFLSLRHTSAYMVEFTSVIPHLEQLQFLVKHFLRLFQQLLLYLQVSLQLCRTADTLNRDAAPNNDILSTCNLHNYTKVLNCVIHLLEDAIFHYVIDSAKYNFLGGDTYVVPWSGNGDCLVRYEAGILRILISNILSPVWRHLSRNSLEIKSQTRMAAE